MKAVFTSPAKVRDLAQEYLVISDNMNKKRQLIDAY
jgi:hypothetical protein